MPSNIVSPVSTVDVPYLPYLDRIARIVYPTKTVIFVTASNWARIAREVAVQQPLADPTKKARPTNANFNELQIMSLMVINAGTDNQDAVNRANSWAEERAGFRQKHDAFRVKPDEKAVPDVFWDDPQRYINDPKDMGQWDN